MNVNARRRKGRHSPVKYVRKAARRGFERTMYAFKLKVLGEERVALASYPRSGNTWLRILLESATELRCGTIYREEGIMSRPDRGLAIKTHQCDSYKYSRAIHLVRHPLDVLDSYYRWKREYARQRTASWERFAARGTSQWVRHTERWLAVRYDVFLLRYEDLYRDPEEGLTRLLVWLGCEAEGGVVRKAVEESTIDRIRQRVPEREGRLFFRRGGTGRSLGHYSPELLALIRERAGGTMERLGYAIPDPSSGEPWFLDGSQPGRFQRSFSNALR